MSSKIQGCTAKGSMQLMDRADGIRNHFCIGRRIVSIGKVYFEFWNELRKGWSSAGTVYISETVAEKKMRSLGDTNANS